MTDEVKRHAFDLFFTTKPRGIGTGLGLALVARVVENVGGSVEIRSRVDHGTTVTLNLLTAPAASDSAPPLPTDPARIAAVSVSDRRVAAMMRLLLNARGVAAPVRADPGACRIAVVEPDQVAALLSSVHQRRPAHAEPVLIVMGVPTDAQRGGWPKIDPIIVDQPNDYFVARDAVSKALERLTKAEENPS